MLFDLPTSVEFGGREWVINTDYRDILTILTAFGDTDLTDDEKAYVCLYDFYKDFEDIPQGLYKEAFDAAMEFIDCGQKGKDGPQTMDWEQDAPLIFPAVNAVAGKEVRAMDYLHWWTFFGFFMEIHDSIFSQVLSIRQKKAKGKKLEKYEREFWQQNLDICKLRPKLTDEEKAEKERLKQLLGG